MNHPSSLLDPQRRQLLRSATTLGAAALPPALWPPAGQAHLFDAAGGERVG